MTSNFLFAVAVLAMTLPAQAALMEVDTGFGVGTGTLDDEQGLILLDIGISNSLTYDELVSSLGSGGIFNGYRLATNAEIEGFLNAGGLSFSTTGALAVTSFNDFVSLIGSPVIDDFGEGCALAVRLLSNDVEETFPADDDFPATYEGSAPFASLIRTTAGPVDCGFDEEEIFRSTADLFFFGDEQLNGIGFDTVSARISGAALVREFAVDVPAPAAMLLFGLAVFGLGMCRSAAPK